MPDATAPPTSDNGTPVLTEQVAGENGSSYERQWYCTPPPPCVTFLVTDSAWSPDWKTRKIFAVSYGCGSESRTGPRRDD